MKTESLYRVVIVEDDEMAIDELVLTIRLNDPGKEFRIAGTAKTGKKAEKVILKEKPDLLFLDIRLPDMQGLELLEEIRDKIHWKMFTVFYTGHSDYMLQAIRQSAFDYLMKPIQQKNLVYILDRFKKEYDKIKYTQPTTATVPVDESVQSQNTYILINRGQIKEKYHIRKIGFFEHDKTQKRWQIHVSELSSPIPLKKNIENGAEKILSYDPKLVKISQSCIINIDYLQYIKGNACILYPPFEKYELLISASCKKNLEDRFFSL